MSRRFTVLPESLLLAALVVLYFAPVLFSHFTEVPWDERGFGPWRSGAAPGAGGLTADPVLSYFPRRAILHEAIRAGRIPLWSEASFCGAPFLANFQSGVLYPPNWLIALVSPERGMGVFAALHVFLLGLGAALFLSDLGVGRAARLAGAVAASWNGFVVARLAHPTALATLAWLPWVLLLSRRLVVAPSARGVALLAGAWALAILGGFPPILVYVGYAAVVVAAFVRLGVASRPIARGLVAGALLLGAGLAAAQLLPTIELSRFSDRATIPFPSILSSAIHPALVIRLVAPAFFGDPAAGNDLSRAFTRGDGHYAQTFLSSGCYLGTAVLALAIAGAFDRRREARALALLAAAGALLAYGSPILRVAVAIVPGFRIARIDRAIALTHVAAALLAAIGLDRAASDAAFRKRLAGALLIVAALCGGLALLGAFAGVDLAAPLLPGAIRGTQPADAARALVRPLLVAAGLAAALIVARRGPARSLSAAWLALPILCLDLGSFAVAHHFPRDTRDFLADTPGLAFLRARTESERASGGGAPRIVRLGAVEPALLPPNLPGLFGLEDAQGYNALAVNHYMAYVKAIEPEARRDRRIVALARESSLDSPLFALLAAPLVVSPRPLADRAPAYAGADLVVTAVPALPRAFLVHHAVRVESADDAIARISSRAIDPRATVLLVGADPERFGLDAAPAAQSESESVVWDAAHAARAARAEEILLRVRAERAAILCVSEVWYPGWEALVDGAPAPLLRANGIFRAVPVGVGEHEVRIRYRPRSFRAGVAVSAIALIVGLGLLAKPQRASGAGSTPVGPSA